MNVSQQDIDLQKNSSTSTPNKMFNPAIYNPAMAAVAEQQSRFYNQFYRTMAIAAVQQQQHQLQQQLPKPHQQVCTMCDFNVFGLTFFLHNMFLYL